MKNLIFLIVAVVHSNFAFATGIEKLDLNSKYVLTNVTCAAGHIHPSLKDQIGFSANPLELCTVESSGYGSLTVIGNIVIVAREVRADEKRPDGKPVCDYAGKPTQFLFIYEKQ